MTYPKEIEDNIEAIRETQPWVDEAIALTAHPDYRVSGLAKASLGRLAKGDDVTAIKWADFSKEHLVSLR